MSGSDQTPGRDGDPAVAELRRRLHQADQAIDIPPGLRDRVRTPRSDPLPLPSRRRWIPPAAAAAVLAVAVVSFFAGALWQRHVSPPAPPYLGHTTAPTAPTGTVTVTTVQGSGGLPAGASCGQGNSSGNTTTCVAIVHSGLDVDHVVASATVLILPRLIQVCLRGPGRTIGCSQYESLTPGHTLLLRWTAHGDEPAGEYCAVTTRLGNDGSKTDIGSYCTDLQP